MPSLVPIPRECNKTFDKLTDHINDLFENDDATLLTVFRLFGPPHLINPEHVVAVKTFVYEDETYSTLYMSNGKRFDTQLHPDVIQKLLTDPMSPVMLQKHVASHAVGSLDFQISTIRAMFQPPVGITEHELGN